MATPTGSGPTPTGVRSRRLSALLASVDDNPYRLRKKEKKEPAPIHEWWTDIEFRILLLGPAFLQAEFRKQREWEKAHPWCVQYVRQLSLQFLEEAEHVLEQYTLREGLKEARQARIPVAQMNPLQKAVWAAKCMVEAERMSSDPEASGLQEGKYPHGRAMLQHLMFKDGLEMLKEVANTVSIEQLEQFVRGEVAKLSEAQFKGLEEDAIDALRSVPMRRIRTAGPRFTSMNRRVVAEGAEAEEREAGGDAGRLRQSGDGEGAAEAGTAGRGQGGVEGDEEEEYGVGEVFASFEGQKREQLERLQEARRALRTPKTPKTPQRVGASPKTPRSGAGVATPTSGGGGRGGGLTPRVAGFGRSKTPGTEKGKQKARLLNDPALQMTTIRVREHVLGVEEEGRRGKSPGRGAGAGAWRAGGTVDGEGEGGKSGKGRALTAGALGPRGSRLRQRAGGEGGAAGGEGDEAGEEEEDEGGESARREAMESAVRAAVSAVSALLAVAAPLAANMADAEGVDEEGNPIGVAAVAAAVGVTGSEEAEAAAAARLESAAGVGRLRAAFAAGGLRDDGDGGGEEGEEGAKRAQHPHALRDRAYRAKAKSMRLRGEVWFEDLFVGEEAGAGEAGQGGQGGGGAGGGKGEEGADEDDGPKVVRSKSGRLYFMPAENENMRYRRRRGSGDGGGGGGEGEGSGREAEGEMSAQELRASILSKWSTSAHIGSTGRSRLPHTHRVRLHRPLNPLAALVLARCGSINHSSSPDQTPDHHRFGSARGFDSCHYTTADGGESSMFGPLPVANPAGSQHGAQRMRSGLQGSGLTSFTRDRLQVADAASFGRNKAASAGEEGEGAEEEQAEDGQGSGKAGSGSPSGKGNTKRGGTGKGLSAGDRVPGGAGEGARAEDGGVPEGPGGEPSASSLPHLRSPNGQSGAGEGGGAAGPSGGGVGLAPPSAAGLLPGLFTSLGDGYLAPLPEKRPVRPRSRAAPQHRVVEVEYSGGFSCTLVTRIPSAELTAEEAAAAASAEADADDQELWVVTNLRKGIWPKLPQAPAFLVEGGSSQAPKTPSLLPKTPGARPRVGRHSWAGFDPHSDPDRDRSPLTAGRGDLPSPPQGSLLSPGGTRQGASLLQLFPYHPSLASPSGVTGKGQGITFQGPLPAPRPPSMTGASANAAGVSWAASSPPGGRPGAAGPRARRATHTSGLPRTEGSSSSGMGASLGPGGALGSPPSGGVTTMPRLRRTSVPGQPAPTGVLWDPSEDGLPPPQQGSTTASSSAEPAATTMRAAHFVPLLGGAPGQPHQERSSLPLLLSPHAAAAAAAGSSDAPSPDGSYQHHQSGRRGTNDWLAEVVSLSTSYGHKGGNSGSSGGGSLAATARTSATRGTARISGSGGGGLVLQVGSWTHHGPTSTGVAAGASNGSVAATASLLNDTRRRGSRDLLAPSVPTRRSRLEARIQAAAGLALGPEASAPAGGLLGSLAATGGMHQTSILGGAGAVGGGVVGAAFGEASRGARRRYMSDSGAPHLVY